jgi:hypothetical protein
MLVSIVIDGINVGNYSIGWIICAPL